MSIAEMCGGFAQWPNIHLVTRGPRGKEKVAIVVQGHEVLLDEVSATIAIDEAARRIHPAGQKSPGVDSASAGSYLLREGKLQV